VEAAATTTTVVGLFDVVGVLAHHQPGDEAKHGEAEHEVHRAEHDEDPRFHSA
jgi:hypothetical protein